MITSNNLFCKELAFLNYLYYILFVRIYQAFFIIIFSPSNDIITSFSSCVIPSAFTNSVGSVSLAIMAFLLAVPPGLLNNIFLFTVSMSTSFFIILHYLYECFNGILYYSYDFHIFYSYDLFTFTIALFVRIVYYRIIKRNTEHNSPPGGGASGERKK